ncbi:MAG TPA: tetratricopeptide repeat protein, partial [Methanolinea sp.]|nr:tetratricopeptide repeat protein [Methanolinea sp.]
MQKVPWLLAVLVVLVPFLAACVSYPDADLAREGDRLLEQGNLEQSLVLFDRAIAINGENVEAWEGRGKALHLMGRESEAFESLNRSLALDPSSAPRWVALGDVLLAMD